VLGLERINPRRQSPNAMSSSYAQLMKANLERVAYAKTDAEIDEEFEKFVLPDATVEVNGLPLSANQFKEAWKGLLHNLDDIHIEWHACFSTDEGLAETPFTITGTPTIGFHYVYTAKIKGKDNAPFESHRIGSVSVAPDGRVIASKLTIIIVKG